MAEKKNELCLWIISPFDGRVKKLRLSRLKLGCLLVTLGIVSAAFVLIATDYGRIQLMRLRSQTAARTMANQVDTLRFNNSALANQINSLKEEKKRVLDFETQVKERLLKLGDVIKEVGKLGVIQKSEEGSAKSGSGIGGAEIDCTPNDSRCEIGKIEPLILEDSLSKVTDLSLKEDESIDTELLSSLENLINTIRILPIGSPVSGKISSKYGIRKSPFSGRWKMHQGIDYSLKYGSPIKSTADGKVKSVKRTGTYGLMIDIEHGDAVVSRYAHLSKALVKAGDEIKRSQTIGLVGSSGRSTGPHLHYEVRVKSDAKNPERLLKLGKELDRAFEKL